MQELEKILEEIEQRKASAEKLIVKPPHDKLDQVANDTAESFIEAYKECQDIIRKHLSRENNPEITRCSRDNDGWIPVDERLPEAGEHVLVSIGTGFNPEKAFLSEDGHWMMLHAPEGYNDITDMVDAWRPLPEPYRPESETEKPDWRQDMLRKFDRRD